MTRKPLRAVVFQHEDHEGVGLIGPALKAAGFTLDPRFRTVRREDLKADLLVVMGGSMAVYDAEQHSFLRDEQALIAERLAQGLPCLGVCLGSQLMAAASGAEVFAGKNGLEIGAAPVRWTKEAFDDPVIHGVSPRTVAAHWHQDTFSAVPGATLLASTDRYTQQAFRLGNSYAFQFHLELTRDDFSGWLQGSQQELEGRGKQWDELKSQLPRLKASEAERKALLARLAEHFAQCAR